jgi:hypothetical protein
MRRLVSTLFVAGLLVLGGAGTASAHQAGPCNDSDGDGMFSGREYAEHHIVPGAQSGFIPNQHKPGTHHGFSLCNPSGK